MALRTLCPALRLLLLLAFTSILPSTIGQQQEIECLVPHKAGDGQRPVYKTGETVQLQWKATFPEFNMSIVQANDQGKYRDRRYWNQPNTTANMFWTARNYDGFSQDDPMHLYIVNADDGDCETCACRSANFTVLDERMGSNTSDSATASVSEAASATSSAPPSGSSDDDKLRLGLGIGLGLGIPLLITLTALATWLCVRRRRQQRRASLSAGGASGAGYDGSMHTSHSESIPLSSTRTYTQPSAFGYSSDPFKKSPAPEMDSQEVVELTAADNERLEAPPDAYRAELAADDGVQRGVGYEKRL